MNVHGHSRGHPRGRSRGGFRGHTRGPTRGVKFRGSRALCLSDLWALRLPELPRRFPGDSPELLTEDFKRKPEVPQKWLGLRSAVEPQHLGIKSDSKVTLK